MSVRDGTADTVRGEEGEDKRASRSSLEGVEREREWSKYWGKKEAAGRNSSEETQRADQRCSDRKEEI